MNPAYLETIFEVEEALPNHFVIITAYNPKGMSAPMSRNVHQDATLKSVLTQRGHDPVRVTGRNHENTHREPGWGAPLSLEEAITIANIFRQEAIYEVINGQIQLIDCKTQDAQAMGEWSERVV